MQKGKIKERLKGAVIGAILTVALMTVFPVVARVAQETITVNFNNIRIAVDGQQIQTEYEPFIFQGRTYLPVRDVANATGFDVTWEDATNTVHLTTRNNLNVVPDYPPHQPVQTPQPPQTGQQGNITIPNNITPRPPARTGSPTNPPISAQRAVELARDHLVSIGVTNARFDYVYMDLERGSWVWSVEFDGQGRSYEFYVDVNTGEFLKAPQGTGNTTTVTPSPQPTQSPSSGSERNNRPTNPAISLQRAIEIAEADLVRRGIDATFHSDSGMDWERGQWVWELEFRVTGAQRGRHVIEFYINVETGDIVKFEWDD